MVKIIFHRYSVFFLFFIIILFSKSFAGDSWVLLSKGKGSNPDIYYDNETITKIENNIVEVYDASITTKGKTIRQLRFDCKKKKFAIGLNEIYIGNNKIQSYDFSKKGWIWFEISNSIERKLADIVCKKK